METRTDPRAKDDHYVREERAERLRVFPDSGGSLSRGVAVWNIDAATRDGTLYTEACWDWDHDADGPIETLPRAVEMAQQFARENVPHLAGTRPFVTLGDLRAGDQSA